MSDEQKISQIMNAIYALRLKNVDNETLAILNNHINGWGRVNTRVPIYQVALDLDLIKEDGTPHNEWVSQSLSNEIGRRIAAGTFV